MGVKHPLTGTLPVPRQQRSPAAMLEGVKRCPPPRSLPPHQQPLPLSRRTCTSPGMACSGRGAVPAVCRGQPGSGRAVGASGLWYRCNARPEPSSPRRSSWSTGERQEHHGREGRQGEPRRQREVTLETRSAWGWIEMTLNLFSPLSLVRGREKSVQLGIYPYRPSESNRLPAVTATKSCPTADDLPYAQPRTGAHPQQGGSCPTIGPTGFPQPNCRHRLLAQLGENIFQRLSNHSSFSFCKFLAFEPAQERGK